MAESLFSDLIDLEDHITDDTVLTKGRGVLAMFSVSGVFPDTADDVDVASWFDVLHNGWKNIAAEDVEVIVYQCRGEADRSVCQSGIYRSDFARDLGEAYMDNLFRRTLYLNQTFIAVLVHAPALATQSLRQFFFPGRKSARAEIEARAARLNEICNLLQSQLSSFGLRRLGYMQRGKVIFDEIAEAIVFALTSVARPIGATTGRMGNAMFAETMRFRRSYIEMQNPSSTSYATMLAMREYPTQTWPGMFHTLAMAPYRNTLVQSFRFLSNSDGIGTVTRKQNKMLAASDKAASQTAALTDAADELMSRQWVLGDHNLVLIAFADNARALSEVSNAAWRDLAACGLVAVRMTRALQAAYLSMLPEGEHWRPRPGFVKSSNFVAMAPLYAFPSGNSIGHWPGPPIITFRTMAGSPFFFHWHVGDVGNTLLTGVPTAGKTLTTGMLIAMTAGRARVVALDHKRGWDFLIRKLGGDYAVLGAGEANFAPLKALDNSPANMEFLTGLIRGCIGGFMTEEENRRLAIGLSIIMSMQPKARRLGELRAFFDNEPEGAGSRLEKWIAGNELGWVIDAAFDTVRFGDLSGLDVTALLANERARGPALLYLFHRITLLLDGSPLLIPIDEGWRALIDPTFRDMIERSIRTIRSKGGAIVFITQSPGDIIESGIARVLTEMCPSQFHLANPRGRRGDYVDGFGLTDGEFDALHELQPGQGMFLLRQGDKSVVAQLPMHGLDEFIPILSAREEDLRRADIEDSSSIERLAAE